MKYKTNSDNSITITDVRNFDTVQIFDCGQCFRFNPKENCSDVYCGVAYGKYIEVSGNQGKIHIFNTSEKEFEDVWKKFFDLDTDYYNIFSSFPEDIVLKNAYNFSEGIRILRQEPWEALCSFIISQNNNIPRIKKIVENLCSTYGEKIYTDKNGKDYFSFPDAKSLYEAGEDAIFSLKTGFRAKYIYDAAKKVFQGEINLDSIYGMNTEEAKNTLMTIKGVGPKVAMCTLLFGFSKYDAFPVDVWVKRILAKYYPDGISYEYFGEFAGVAQQYLFYYERCQSGVYLN